MKALLFISGLLFCLGGNAQSKGHLSIDVDPAVQALQEKFTESQGKQKRLLGYRVQIYNGSKDDCLARRTDFLKVYPDIPVYTLYESPEYRIQVGDFRSRLEAEKYLSKILKEFPGSFTIKTEIRWPELSEG